MQKLCVQIKTNLYQWEVEQTGRQFESEWNVVVLNTKEEDIGYWTTTKTHLSIPTLKRIK